MYKELKQLAESRLYPLHMPGHKRQLDDPYLGPAMHMDITEIDGFDNLQHPTGIIRDLEQRLAEYFHADRARFLVNGSTSGVLAAISALMAARPHSRRKRESRDSIVYTADKVGAQTDTGSKASPIRGQDFSLADRDTLMSKASPIQGQDFSRADRDTLMSKASPIQGQDFSRADRGTLRSKASPIQGQDFSLADRNTLRSKAFPIQGQDPGEIGSPGDNWSGAGWGKTLLMARNSHKSAYDAAYLNRIGLRFLMPEEIPLWRINGGIAPSAVKAALAENPDIEGVFLTSPTYEGIISDIGAISSICHQKGLPLIVDSAHGAHLGLYNPFTKKFRCPDAFAEGADLVIESLHKTLPSFNQTAMILYREDLIDPRLIERFTSLFQTSSPSYVFMAGADKCLDIMEKEGEDLFQALDHRLSKLKDQVRNMRHVRIFEGEGLQRYSGYGLDPTKLLIAADGMTGREIYDFLRQEHYLQPEMASDSFCLAMMTVMDREEAFSRLTEALVHLEKILEGGQRDCSGNEEVPGPDSLEKAGGTAVKDLKRSIGKSSDSDSSEEAGVTEAGTSDRGIEATPDPDSLGEAGGTADKDNIYEEETGTDKLPPSAMTIYEALSLPGTALPLMEAEGRVSGAYVYAFPPDIPLLIPGDIITRSQIRRITAMESSGIQIHGMQKGKILCTEQPTDKLI